MLINGQFDAVNLSGKLWRFGSNLVDLYVDFVMGWTARVLLATALIIYWAFSAYGGEILRNFSTKIAFLVAQIKVGLTSEKLFLDDSPLLDLVKLQTDVIFKEGGQVRFIFKSTRG